jgi:hypothetical protein
MKKKLLFTATAVFAACGSALAQVQPQIDLEYCVSEVVAGQLYQYEFTLKPNANWAPGMGWRWLIFGDEPHVQLGGTGVSPLTNWNGSLTTFPVGPWTSFTSSGGGHNGPTFNSVLDYWIPASATETLRWIGTSNANLQQGQMKWSTLAGTVGGATAADFTIATLTCGGPAPCYANCDQSTVAPILNVGDFTCFLQRFAAGDSYANCDNSTVAPVLNVGDFTCFLQRFAAGCP